MSLDAEADMLQDSSSEGEDELCFDNPVLQDYFVMVMLEETHGINYVGAAPDTPKDKSRNGETPVANENSGHGHAGNESQPHLITNINETDVIQHLESVHEDAEDECFCQRFIAKGGQQSSAVHNGVHHPDCPRSPRLAGSLFSPFPRHSIAGTVEHTLALHEERRRASCLATGGSEDTHQKKESPWKTVRRRMWQRRGLGQKGSSGSTGPLNGRLQTDSGETSSEKKTKGSGFSATLSRLFSRQKRDQNENQVFTVTDEASFEEQKGESSIEMTDFGPAASRRTSRQLPGISLRHRCSNNSNDNWSPSPLPNSSNSASGPRAAFAQLSIDELCTFQNDVSSEASLVTSDSVGSGSRRLAFGTGKNGSVESGARYDNEEKGSGGKKPDHARVRAMSESDGRMLSGSSSLTSQYRGSRPRLNRKSVSFQDVQLMEGGMREEGPYGKYFTARLFNRIGKRGVLSNVTQVCHVYKGTILVTDLLEGRILHMARSGRTAKHFVTEPGSEPWCSCITPQGHVAVTLTRPACVAVWSGNGGLVREFGHGVLQCPTGLTCDRRGRFIVTDKQTNRVAFFSASGEFLKYLYHAPSQEGTSTSSLGSRNESKDSLCCNNEDCDRSSEDTEDDDTCDECDITPMMMLHRNPSNEGDKNGESSTNGIHQNEDSGTGKDTRSEDCCSSSSASSTQTEDKGEPFVFSLPRYVCVSASGKIIVSNSGTHSVMVFSPEGRYLYSIGSYGSGDGQLKVPYGVCCDQQENVYIADHYNDRVCAFSITGDFLQHVLTSVSGLSRPKSVALRPAHVRKLYVAHGGLRSTEVLAYRLESEQTRITFKFDL